MSSLPYFPEPGQVVFHIFDFIARIKSAWIEYDRKLIPAPGSDMTFDPFECFNFIQNPNFTIGNHKLALLEVDPLAYLLARIGLTDRFLEYLPSPELGSIKLSFIITPLNAPGVVDIQELKAILVYHFLEPGLVGDVQDGVLTTWPGNYKGMDFMSEVRQLRQPRSLPKPKQITETQAWPPLHIVPQPKPFKPDQGMEIKAPPKLLEYFLWLAPKSAWRMILRYLYKRAWCGDITNDPFYPGKKSHIGWYYSGGIEWLANATGLSERTIIRALKLMREHNIIQLRYEGGKGKGNNIYELPKNKRHYMRWKKHPKTQGRPPRKPKKGR